MSKGELVYNLYLLQSLCDHEELALIEADKLEYLTKEGKWESFTNFELKYIPVLVKAVPQTNENEEHIYELSYKLLSPNIEITPEKTERIILSKDQTKKGLYTKKYSTLKNEQAFEEAIIRYSNKKTNTFSKLKNQEEQLIFLRRNRRKLQKTATTINDNVKVKTMTLK